MTINQILKAKINFLKKIHFDKITNQSLVYTSGTGGLIKSGVPIGKVVDFDPKVDQDINIDFFSDFSQLQYVSVTAFNKINQEKIEEQITENSSWKNNILLDGPALRKKLDLLLQEKEINDQITDKIKLENETLKNQISKNQKDLINNQKIIKIYNIKNKSYKKEKKKVLFSILYLIKKFLNILILFLLGKIK